MPSPLDDLIDLLDLEAIEVNIFRGHSPDEKRQRVFGGQVAGQALVAAARTVEHAPGDGPPRYIHSLHAYFLRPGDPNAPILYEVDRIRDGKSFSTRRVVAIQHGKAIFNLQASFHVYEEGLDHQIPMPPDVPPPDGLPDFKTRMAPYKDALGDYYERPRPIDVRYIEADVSGMKRITAGTTSRIDLREQVLNFPSQPVITKDNVTIDIDAVLYYRIADPQKATYAVQNLPYALETLTRTTLRNIVGEM